MYDDIVSVQNDLIPLYKLLATYLQHFSSNNSSVSLNNRIDFSTHKLMGRDQTFFIKMNRITK